MIWCFWSAIFSLLLADKSNAQEQAQQILNQNKQTVQTLDVRFTIATDILVRPVAGEEAAASAVPSPPSPGLDQSKTVAQRLAEARKQAITQTPLRQMHKDESPVRSEMVRRLATDGHRTYREEAPLAAQAKEKIITFNDGQHYLYYKPDKQQGAVFTKPNKHDTLGFNDPRWLITLDGPATRQIQDSIAKNKLRSEVLDNGQTHIMAEGPVFSYEVWLDPQFGNLPVRIVEYLRGRIFIDHHDIKHVLTSGGWFPISGLCDKYLPHEPYTLANTQRLQVDQESLIVNGPVSEEILNFEFPVGTSVTDEALGETFVAGVKNVDQHIESLVAHAASMPSDSPQKSTEAGTKITSIPKDTYMRNQAKSKACPSGYIYGVLGLASMAAVISCLWAFKRRTSIRQSQQLTQVDRHSQ